MHTAASIPVAVLLCMIGSSIGYAQPPAAPPIASDVVQSAVTQLPDDFVIGPEDVLGIVFWREPDMTGDVTVRPDGRITLPVIGELAAAGLRPEQLQKQLAALATKYINDPNVAVVVRTINSRKVFVTGRVTTPGTHALNGPLTVMQALALAGGVTEYADSKNITVLRTVGGQTRSFKFNYRDVVRGKNLSQNMLLQPGDTVVVP